MKTSYIEIPSDLFHLQEIIARFMRNVKKNNNCWEWKGLKNKMGYAVFSINNKWRLAHRVSYSFFVDSIPNGFVIDHLCKNKKCVNPEHLEAVTQKENIMRSESIMASRSKQKFCLRGHEFVPKNTTIKSNGTRACKTCQLIDNQEFNKRNPHYQQNYYLTKKWQKNFIL